MPTNRPEVKAAHWTVSNAKRQGKLALPQTLACNDCGKPARCYDHYLGYSPEHRLDVQPVCYSCHWKRAWSRGEFKSTPEWREKLRQKMLGNDRALGYKQSPEHIEKRASQRRGNPGAMLGRKFSEEHRRNMSESGKRRWQNADDSLIQKAVDLGKRNKGRKHTEESRRKMGASHLGSKRSAETRKKMSEARKLWWLSHTKP